MSGKIGILNEGAYLVVINDIRLASGLLSAHKIVEFLFQRGMWIFRAESPFVREFEPGKRLIFYIGGKTGAFVAECTIASGLLPMTDQVREEVQQIGLTWFTRFVKISEPRYLSPPRQMRQLLPRLNFVANKKYFGTSLRVGMRRLSRNDVDTILNNFG
jgi:hypothetical protein